MRIKLGQLKKLIREVAQPVSNDLEVGDLVDVALDSAYGVYKKIRVLELVPNVEAASGVSAEGPGSQSWTGQGFLGRNEDEENYDLELGDEGWYTLGDVVPRSKGKYFFAR